MLDDFTRENPMTDQPVRYFAPSCSDRRLGFADPVVGEQEFGPRRAGVACGSRCTGRTGRDRADFVTVLHQAVATQADCLVVRVVAGNPSMGVVARRATQPTLPFLEAEGHPQTHRLESDDRAVFGFERERGRHVLDSPMALSTDLELPQGRGADVGTEGHGQLLVTIAPPRGLDMRVSGAMTPLTGDVRHHRLWVELAGSFG